MPQDVNEDFRKFLREKRNELGINASEMDLIVFKNKKISYTSRFENGNKKMTLDTLGRFLDALDFEIKFVKKT